MTFDLAHAAALVGGVAISAAMVPAGANRRSAPGALVLVLACFAAFVIVALASADPIGPYWYLMVIVAIIMGAVIGEVLTPRPEPVTFEDEDLASITRAARILEESRRTVADFDAGRRGIPILRRFVDSFIVTGDESLRDRALGRMEAAQAHIGRTVGPWTLARAEELLARDPQGAQEADEAHEGHVPHRVRIEAASDLLSLALQARQDLIDAISALDSARSMEMLDAVSSNKGISIMSTSSTSNAAHAVECAQASITRLSQEAGAVKHVLPQVGDTFDFMLDMALDLPLDFMSWVNMGRLSTAIETCTKALDAVGEDVERLEDLREDAVIEGHATLARWYDATGPYIAAAVRDLPPSVHDEAPTAMPLRPMTKEG